MTTLSVSEFYMNMLNPLSFEIKLDILNRLAASLKNRDAVVSSDSEDFFAELRDGWDDGMSVEDTISEIRSSKQSNITRPEPIL